MQVVPLFCRLFAARLTACCCSCLEGFSPTDDYTACYGCTGPTYSPCGQGCNDCAFPAVVNTNHSTCEVSDAAVEDPALVVAALENSNVLPTTTLEIAADPAALVDGSQAQLDFIAALKADLAASLGVDPSQLVIGGLQAATPSGGRRRTQSTEITFEVTITGDDAGATLTSLVTQMDDPTSALMTSSVAGNINPAVVPSFAFVCPVGMYRKAGDADCQICAGTAVPDAANDYTSCRDCLPGRAPGPLGDVCVCAEGYYNSSKGPIHCYNHNERWDAQFSEAPDDECASCAEVESCVMCGIDEVILRPGFAVSDSGRQQGVPFEDMVGQRGVFKCAVNGTCKGNPLDPCENGYQGPLCANCAAGWSRPGFLGECNLCEGAAGSYIWFVVGGVLGVSLVVGALYFVGSVSGNSVGNTVLIVTFTKIIVTLVQILTQLGFALELQWPEPFLSLIGFLKVFSFDWLSFLDIGCMATYDYYTKFVFAMFLMPALLGGVAAVYFAQSAKGVADIKDRCIKMALTAIFLIFPMVSQTIFQGFSCTALDESESWLFIDRQINCNEDGYKAFIYGLGTLGVLIYPIGYAPSIAVQQLTRLTKDLTRVLTHMYVCVARIPAVTLFILMKNKDDIRTYGDAYRRYDVRKYVRALSHCISHRLCLSLAVYSQFLVADYKPEYHYFDAIEMMRKVFMTGLLIFFQKGSLFQMVIAMFFSMIYGGYVAWCLPYRVTAANLAKVGTETALLGTLMLSIMLKVDLSREDIAEWDVSMLLAFNNIAIPGGALIVSFVCFGDEMMNELRAGMPDLDAKALDDLATEYSNPVDDNMEASTLEMADNEA